MLNHGQDHRKRTSRPLCQAARRESLPERFTLLPEKVTVQHICHVVWGGERLVGVKFFQAQP
jgi:hypothetical protein